MTFTDYSFLILFLLSLAAYWLVKRKAWQNALLLIASYLFYGWVNPWYVLLLGLSTAVDYFLALAMSARRERAKNYLILSLIVNVGVLAFFKYANFFAADISRILSALGLTSDGTALQILLPVGLSFYTLKKLAYIIDVSRGTLEPARDPLAFALFVSYFPQLNAGPIDRAQNLLPQIQSDRVWKSENFQRAWPLLVMGFFKKIVIAASLGAAVDKIFVLQSPSPLMVAAASLGFMFQLLADFAAYTDISRGVSFLFGFETPENFNAPFLALTPTDFWSRWHITLAAWLRDYVYIPLGGSRVATWRVYLNILLTFLLSGVWHGAGWTYVIWGLYFGVLSVIYRALGLGGKWKPANGFTRFVSWAVMFGLLLVAFMIFRIPSFAWLAGVLRGGSLTGSSQEIVVALATLSSVLLYGLPLFIKHHMDRRLAPQSIFFDLYFVFAALAILFYVNAAPSEFIYFQF
jgi:D-alanyl-lipoteichoic acid acyltransferase DltB (MBOAT superfamily)